MAEVSPAVVRAAATVVAFTLVALLVVGMVEAVGYWTPALVVMALRGLLFALLATILGAWFSREATVVRAVGAWWCLLAALALAGGLTAAWVSEVLDEMASPGLQAAIGRALDVSVDALRVADAAAWTVGLLSVGSFAAARTLGQRASELQRQAWEAKLDVRRARLDPHFVFNTLNAALEAMPRGQGVGRLTVEKLETYFRYVVRTRSRVWASMEAEFTTFRTLLQLEKARFEEALSLDFQIDEDAFGLEVPVLLGLPLIENAIKHGAAGDDEIRRISLCVRRRDDMLILRVANTGEWIPPSEDAEANMGAGLEILRYRLNAYYPDCHVLTFAQEAGWVVATLTLPSRPPSVRDFTA